MKSETFRTEGTAMADMTDDERRHAEMKMRHERAHRMRQRLVKQQETEMNDDEWVRIAKRIAAGQETRICKRQWHEQIVKRAADDRRENETPEQSYSRFLCETSDGAALYQAYRLAPQGDEAEPARTVTPTMPAPTPSYERLMGKAEELRKSDPKELRQGLRGSRESRSCRGSEARAHRAIRFERPPRRAPAGATVTLSPPFALAE
jgi:hypothetical protein